MVAESLGVYDSRALPSALPEELSACLVFLKNQVKAKVERG